MNTPMEDLPIVDRQLFWHELTVGKRCRTINHRIVESDCKAPDGLPNERHVRIATSTSPFIPAERIYRIMEDVIATTLVHRAGYAMVECAQCVQSAFRIGDTIHAIVEVEEVQPDWLTHQALVLLNVDVRSERGGSAMSYSTSQKISGAPQFDLPQRQSPHFRTEDSRRGAGPSARTALGLSAHQLFQTAADHELANGRLAFPVT